MEIQDLTGKLTNDIIKRGGKNLFSIGALFLIHILEKRGFDYSCVDWGNSSGYVGIFNEPYEVFAYYEGKPFEMMSAEPTFFNKLFPKKITLKFEYIG